MKTIMVTGIGGPAGISVAAQLAQRRRAGRPFRIVGVDIAELHNDDADVLDVAAPAAAPMFAVSMLELFARYEPDLVIPTVSDELPQIATLAELLELQRPAPGGRGRIVVSAPGPTAVAADKLLTMWRLERAGVPVPAYAPATAFASAADALGEHRSAVVLKPRVSRGGRGVRLIESGAEPWRVDDGSWIVQDFAPGTEYSPQVYVSPLTGQTTVVLLEKTALKQGRVGNAVDVVRLPQGIGGDVAEVAAEAVVALGLVGPIDMDVRRDVRGRPVVLEVNSRFGANCAHAPELLDAVLLDWLGGRP